MLTSAQPYSKPDSIPLEADASIMTLYNGSIYQSKNFNKRNHPFLDENTWMPGSITLDQYDFNSISLKYDIITDKVVINLSLSGTGIAIQPSTDRIDGFSLGDRKFKQFTRNDYSNCTPGFYEVNCQGEFSVFTRFRKENPKNDITSDLWDTKEEFYLANEGSLVRIRKRRDLLKYFEKQLHIGDYIDSMKFPYRISNTELLVQLCNYLNTCPN